MDLVVLLNSLISLTVFTVTVHGQCKYPTHRTNPDFQEAKRRLEPLMGLSAATQVTTLDNQYSYSIGICRQTDVIMERFSQETFVGAMQTELLKDKRQYNIGQYNQSELMAGKNWVMLEYAGGDLYSPHHCNGSSRRTIIMFLCDPDKTDKALNLRLVAENSDKETNCYYLFETEHSVICSPENLLIRGLSPGSIVVIIFCTLFGTYLIVGILYMRFMKRAKGLEQIPNYSFWKDFGNLQADGCDFVCRSRRHVSANSYRGIGDDQLQNEDDEKDDHLLPM